MTSTVRRRDRGKRQLASLAVLGAAALFALAGVGSGYVPWERFHEDVAVNALVAAGTLALAAVGYLQIRDAEARASVERQPILVFDTEILVALAATGGSVVVNAAIQVRNVGLGPAIYVVAFIATTGGRPLEKHRHDLHVIAPGGSPYKGTIQVIHPFLAPMANPTEDEYEVVILYTDRTLGPIYRTSSRQKLNDELGVTAADRGGIDLRPGGEASALERGVATLPPAYEVSTRT